MDRQKQIEKLAKIKALAERGVGGEKQTALKLYGDLKKKHGIEEKEVQQASGTAEKAITQADYQNFWGLAFGIGIIANNLHDEMELCAECEKGGLREECEAEDCPVFENIRGLQMSYEHIQNKLWKAVAVKGE